MRERLVVVEQRLAQVEQVAVALAVAEDLEGDGVETLRARCT